MSAPARLVVGVEVHVQLRTRTKCFCPCPADFAAVPNSACCPVCLGHPGALPVLNRAAVEAALRAGAALGCRLVPRGQARWDRKNYFYPDLAKGYQITQQAFPLCEEGSLALASGGTVRIRRAHLEEDTGRSSHADDGATLLDFNRSGVALLEIVSEPDLGTPEEVEDYLRRLQERLRLAGASDCSMEKGQMRCEPNVNLVRADGSATAISELKNLNSFAAARAAVAFEAKRLADGPWHPAGAAPPRATYGWDDDGGRTVLQRTKETAADYRYFPEPDLPSLPAAALAPLVEAAKAAWARAEAGAAAAASAAGDLAARWGMTPAQAKLLLAQDTTRGLFRKCVERAEALGIPPADAGSELAKWFTGPLAGTVKEHGGDWAKVRATPDEIAEVLSLQVKGALSRNAVKTQVLQTAWILSGRPLAEILPAIPKSTPPSVRPTTDGTTAGTTPGGADDPLRAACAEVLAANPDVVAKIKGGKPQAKAALVGQVMKKTRGAADPAKVNAILDELLGS